MVSRRAAAISCFFLFATLIMVGRLWRDPWTEAFLMCFGITGYLGPVQSSSASSSNATIIGDNPYNIPLIVHQMWKTGSSPPSETVRWRDGCIQLNPYFEFRMYDDNDLLLFAEQSYPRYLAMFRHLSGVYMADMARVLVTYHYGGIYADLDFYCHRPYRCLLRKAMNLLHDGRYDSKFESPPSISRDDSTPRDILIVSREPMVHAVLFRNKSRVVIQDFFMATPRHPFFLWLLEDRLKLFNNSATGIFPKGPFSYSIEKDIDRYLEYKRAVDDSSKKTVTSGRKKRKASRSPNVVDAVTQQTPPQLRARTLRGRKGAPTPYRNSSRRATVAEDLIVELQEDVMHPLVDATNPRLYSTCAASQSDLASQRTEDGLLSRDSPCGFVDRRLFFNPSNETVLVHMWTHVFLGWSMLRGIRNAFTYSLVERSLPPSKLCSDE